MIGKVIGAVVGNRIAQHTRGVKGPTGAALGVVATTLLGRLSLPGMLAIAAGGYAAKRLSEKKDTKSKDTTATL